MPERGLGTDAASVPPSIIIRVVSICANVCGMSRSDVLLDGDTGFPGYWRYRYIEVAEAMFGNDRGGLLIPRDVS